MVFTRISKHSAYFLLPKVIEPIGLFKEEINKYFKNFIKKIWGGGIVFRHTDSGNKKVYSI